MHTYTVYRAPNIFLHLIFLCFVRALKMIHDTHNDTFPYIACNLPDQTSAELEAQRLKIHGSNEAMKQCGSNQQGIRHDPMERYKINGAKRTALTQLRSEVHFVLGNGYTLPQKIGRTPSQPYVLYKSRVAFCEPWDRNHAFSLQHWTYKQYWMFPATLLILSAHMDRISNYMDVYWTNWMSIL